MINNIKPWRERAAEQYPDYEVADLHKHVIAELANAEIADLRAALARAPLPAQGGKNPSTAILHDGVWYVPYVAPVQAGDARDAERLLCQLVKSEVGKQTLWRLSDGIGTDTDEGRAWLKAKELAASIDAAMSASQGQDHTEQAK